MANITNIISVCVDKHIAAASEWSVSSCVSLFVTVVGGLLNLCVLSSFLWRPSLRNPFAIYVINVLIVDLILALAHGPLNVIERYYPSWQLGLPVCFFYVYLSYTFQSLINFAHFLRALNRVWAVTFPFSYRTDHTTKFAVVLCISVWLIIHSCQIPTTVLTSVIKPVSDNASSLHCTIEPAMAEAWSWITEVVLYEVPLVLVLISYPVVCYKSFFGGRGQQITPLSTFQRNRLVSTARERNASVRLAEGARDGRRTVICGTLLHGSRTGFITLSLMFVSVIVCLLPNEVYFTWVMVTGKESYDVYLVVDALQRLTTVVDPMVIVLGNTELRRHWLDLAKIQR